MPILSETPADDLNVVDIHQPYSAFNSTRDIPAAGLSTGAFTVLSADSPLTLGAGKPNAIVRPTRRRDPTDHRGSEHTQLFDHVDNTRSGMAAEEGVITNEFGERHFELGSFTKELDLKLRRLQGYGKKSSSKNV